MEVNFPWKVLLFLPGKLSWQPQLATTPNSCKKKAQIRREISKSLNAKITNWKLSSREYHYSVVFRDQRRHQNSKNLLSKIELHSLWCWSIITGHESPSKRHEEVKTELDNLAQRALPECRTKRWRNVNCKSWARIWEDGLFAVLQNQSHGREGGSRDQREQGETSRTGDGLPEYWAVSTVLCWWTSETLRIRKAFWTFQQEETGSHDYKENGIGTKLRSSNNENEEKNITQNSKKKLIFYLNFCQLNHQSNVGNGKFS